MKFGICTAVENADLVKVAGGDFVEENVQQFLQGDKEQWTGLERLKGRSLPVPAANALVPGSLKITGPSVDMAALRKYMTNVTARAQQAGLGILVFGSAGARNVPEGFDRAKAKQQILEFIRMAADLAGKHQVTLVAEPLNKGESNIINTVAEAMEYVRAVNHAHFQCLVDSWHFWLEKEPLENLRAAMPWIKHVHLADVADRRAPGQTVVDGRKQDYTSFFRVLKEGHYAGLISVEALWSPAVTEAGEAARVLAYVKEQWSRA